MALTTEKAIRTHTIILHYLMKKGDNNWCHFVRENCQENAITIFIHFWVYILFLVRFIHFGFSLRAFRLAQKWHAGAGPTGQIWSLEKKKKTRLLNGVVWS